MAATLEELEAQLAALQTQVQRLDSEAATLKTEVVNLDELVRDVGIQSWNGAADLTASATLTLLTGMTACKIRALSMVMEYTGVAASDTDYWTFTLRKGTAARGWTNIAVRSTRSTGPIANGPIVPRVPWKWDGAPFADVMLAADDALQVVAARNGNPAKLDLPVVFSVGYVPA